MPLLHWLDECEPASEILSEAEGRRAMIVLQLAIAMNRKSLSALTGWLWYFAIAVLVANGLNISYWKGPITALAFSLTLGTIERFAHSRQVISYLGLNPAEHSSGGWQRLGAISQQGNPLLRSGLVEAGQSAARCVPELKRAYQRLKHRKHSAVAKVMVARKLAVRRLDVEERAALLRRSHAGPPESSCGRGLRPST